MRLMLMALLLLDLYLAYKVGQYQAYHQMNGKLKEMNEGLKAMLSDIQEKAPKPKKISK